MTGRPTITRVTPIIGMEIHVELKSRRKVFAPSPNPAHPAYEGAAANALIDPVVLALPGALPVIDRGAVEMAVLVGLALNCSIAETSRWDRKSYTYPDLPKGYQISQDPLPLCFDGYLEVPGGAGEAGAAGASPFRVGIIRAHLEEDAGKLMHEAPGGGRLDFSIVDLNRAGTPLLEIVSQPDMRSAGQAVAYAKEVRRLCRFLGVTEGVMQKGHMRFEPNVNCELLVENGSGGSRRVRTPITEVKNLNSFRAVEAAIEHEVREQPGRWLETGFEFGFGTKTTRGWDDAAGRTVVQREKEEAHDYRYFPDPDLPPVRVGKELLAAIRARLVEPPAARARRYVERDQLSPAEATVLVDERALADLFEEAADEAAQSGLRRAEAAKAVANVLLQQMAALAKARGVGLAELGLDARQVAAIARLRAGGSLQSANAMKLIERLTAPSYKGKNAEAVAEYEGWLVVRDDAALERWVDEVIAANGAIVEQIRGGKQQAVGRLIGEVMKKSGGAADAKAVREKLLERIG